eukprot:TRINITY_DN76726_c0_g1_i1.p1 TRINITY_DN76726_c0_g1~~TRINITY_DN76726_c0_g1_i1.p1  ORF type:complete len:1098 (-),score=252.89 TRINITY_DN76726_c0_g1_i1:40-2934(-)
MWEEIHKLSASEMRKHAEEAKGLFIKAGQVMSAMVGQLPDSYTSEFLSLTDHLPVSTIDEVYRTIQKTFMKSPKDIFSEFDSEPLASASIAQVHKARLKSTGEIVAVKVQHEGVDRIFLEDVGTLSTCASQVAYWSPDLDMRKFAEEWGESLPRELDFVHERHALSRAGDALRKAGSHCIVPKVHDELFGPHAFVMEFIEAGPILDMGDPEFCARNNVDKRAVLMELLHAFGVMAFKDGMFHADPHAGNVRLVIDKSAPGGARPVLLDWGLFREISDEERMGLAKVFYSLSNFDISGLFDVLESLGFHLKSELLTDQFKRDLLEKARGLMKDTVGREKTRADVKEQMAEYKARLARAEKDGDQTKGSMSPLYFLEDWPRCIIFFMRMMQILRGLCVAMDAEGMPILHVFAQHARQALQEGSRQQMLTNRLRIFAGREGRKGGEDSPSSLLVPEARAANLDKRMREVLEDLIARRKVVGGQVAIIQDGRLICDVAAGTLSTIDARGVEAHTRFPLLGATAGVASLALLRALRRNAAVLLKDGATLEELLQKTPVSRVWPAFAGGDSDVTLAQLLSHCAGLQDAYPPDFCQSSLDDFLAMEAHFEQTGVLGDSQACQDARFAYMLQVFVLSKLGDCLGGQGDFMHWLGNELGPLGLDAAMPAGRGREASVCRDLPELARVSMNEVQAARTRRRQQVQQDGSGAELAGAESGGSSGSKQGPGRSRNLLQAMANDPLVFDPLQGNAGAGGLFRAGLSLGASARGLAQMLASKELRDELAELQALELAGTDKTALGWLLTGGARQWTAGGLQVLSLRGSGVRALLGSQAIGYGVVSGFGPLVAHFPDLAPGGVTLAVTVNDVLRGRQAAAELVSAALRDFGVVPAWPDMSMQALADAAQVARSPDVAPLLDNFGGFEGLQKLLSLQQAAESTEQAAARGSCCTSGMKVKATSALLSLGQCCEGFCRSSK